MVKRLGEDVSFISVEGRKILVDCRSLRDFLSAADDPRSKQLYHLTCDACFLI